MCLCLAGVWLRLRFVFEVCACRLCAMLFVCGGVWLFVCGWFVRCLCSRCVIDACGWHCFLGGWLCVSVFCVLCLCLGCVAEVQWLSFACYAVCVCRAAFVCVFVVCLLLCVMTCVIEDGVCPLPNMLFAVVGLCLSVNVCIVCFLFVFEV